MVYWLVVPGCEGEGKRPGRLKDRRYRMVSMILGVALTGDISHWAGLRWRRTRRDADTEVMEVFELLRSEETVLSHAGELRYDRQRRSFGARP